MFNPNAGASGQRSDGSASDVPEQSGNNGREDLGDRNVCGVPGGASRTPPQDQGLGPAEPRQMIHRRRVMMGQASAQGAMAAQHTFAPHQQHFTQTPPGAMAAQHQQCEQDADSGASESDKNEAVDSRLHKPDNYDLLTDMRQKNIRYNTRVLAEELGLPAPAWAAKLRQFGVRNDSDLVKPSDYDLLTTKQQQHLRYSTRELAKELAVPCPDWAAKRHKTGVRNDGPLSKPLNYDQGDNHQRNAFRGYARKAAVKLGKPVPDWAAPMPKSDMNLNRRAKTLIKPDDFDRLPVRKQLGLRASARRSAENQGMPHPEWAKLKRVIGKATIQPDNFDQLPKIKQVGIRASARRSAKKQGVPPPDWAMVQKRDAGKAASALKPEPVQMPPPDPRFSLSFGVNLASGTPVTGASGVGHMQHVVTVEPRANEEVMSQRPIIQSMENPDMPDPVIKQPSAIDDEFMAAETAKRRRRTHAMPRDAALETLKQLLASPAVRAAHELKSFKVQLIQPDNIPKDVKSPDGQQHATVGLRGAVARETLPTGTPLVFGARYIADKDWASHEKDLAHVLGSNLQSDPATAARFAQERALNYSWESFEGEDYHMSAYGAGNVATLVNHDENKPNMSLLHVPTKDKEGQKSPGILMYFTNREVKAGEQLLIDYGHLYNFSYKSPEGLQTVPDQG